MSEYYSLGWDLPLSSYKYPRSGLSTKQDKKVLIKNIQSLIRSTPDIKYLRTDDEFIARFVIASKYNLEESFKLYCSYYSYRERNTEIFRNCNAQNVLIQQALRDGFPGVLDKRDRKGRCILLLIASRWNHSCYSLLTIYKSLLLTLEFLIAQEINQHNGFVLIIDWTEFTFKQSSSLNPRILKLIMEGLQDCFPAKFKGVHFIGQPWYVEAALTLIKPTLKDKSKQKIYLHGNNLSTLHDYVTKDILPTELGGEGPPYNPLPWAEKLINAAVDEQMSQFSNNLKPLNSS